MSKFRDFVIGMNESAGITPAGAILLSQFENPEKTQALNSIKANVRNAFQGIRSAVTGKSGKDQPNLAQTVADSRRAARVRGTQENFLLLQTNLLRTVAQSMQTMNAWLESMVNQIAAEPTPAPTTTTKPAPVRRTPARNAKGQFVARELTLLEKIARSFQSMKYRALPAPARGPAVRDPKTGRFTPRPSETAWMRTHSALMKSLRGMQSSLEDIHRKTLKPLVDKGIRFRDKGKELVESMRKFLSPSEWSKKLQATISKPFAPLMKLFESRNVVPVQQPDVTAPEAAPAAEEKKRSGFMERMSNFMADIRQTFEELPGVGAATSLMVMKVAKEQTKELTKIRQILEQTYKLDEAAEARAERAEDAKEETDFETRAKQARVMPTFDRLKKEKDGGWFGGLIQTIFGELIEGMMIRYGLKGLGGRLLTKFPIFGKIGGLLKKIPGVGKILSLLGRIGEFFEKIPGIGKLFRFFKVGGAAAGGIGVLGKLGAVGEWLGGLTKVFSKIPGLTKLLSLGKGVLGKLAWPITVIMGIFDFFSGWKDAGTILGKAEDQVTLIDRMGAGLGSVLGGLVGILDSILSIFGIKTDIGGFVKKWTAKLYSVVYGFLWDSIMKPFKMVGENLAKLFGFRSLQSAIDFASFKLDKGTKYIKDVFGKMVTGIGDYLSNLKKKAMEGINKMGAAISDFFRNTINWATEGVKNIASAIGNKFVAIGDSVAEYLGFDSMKSAYEALKNKVIGVFSGIGAGVAKLLGFENFSGLVDKVVEIKDQILKPFNWIQEKIGGFVKGLGKVAGFLGYDDKEFQAYEKRVNDERTSTARARAQQEQNAREAARRAEQQPNAPIQVPRDSVDANINAPGATLPPATGSAAPYDPTLDISRGNTLPVLRSATPTRLPAGGDPVAASTNEPQRLPEGQGASWVRPIMSGVTSDFGMRKHPVTGQEQKMHQGTDYAGKMGDPVKAAGDGVVQLASSLNGYGNVVYLNHSNGYQTRYAHLSAFAPLSIGQNVKAGQVIGAVGNTGIGTGPHLHFEVRKGWSLANKDTKPENPEIFFRSQQQDQEDRHTERPAAPVPVQRPPRDPDVMTGWSRPRIASGTGLGKITETVLSNLPSLISTRPVVPPRDPSMRTPTPGQTPGGNMGSPSYRPGYVPPEIADIAVKMEKETGVPAAVTIAQWATESGWGQKAIGNNVFGITKARRHSKSQLKSTTEDITYEQFKKFSPAEQASVRSMDGSTISGPWQGKMKVRMDREFADFDTLEDSFRDHSRLLSSGQGPYKAAFERYKATGDVQSFIRDIAPTYATDRNYANVIGNIARQQNVTSAISSARNSLGVESAPPVTLAQAPTVGRDITRTMAETGQLSRSLSQKGNGGTLNVAPVNVNQQTTSIIADLKARNSENTHKRILEKEYYRT